MSVDGMRRVPLLACLPEHRLQDFKNRFPMRSLPRGAVVARAGDGARHLIVLEDGELTGAIDTAHGATVRLASAVGPCVVDKVATLGGGVHTATWTTATQCRVRLLPSAVLERLLDEEPALRRHVVRYLADAVDAERRSRIRRTTLASPAHVAAWLMEARTRYRSIIPLMRGQQGLAEELGLSRVTVSRALQALVTRGAVRVQRRGVEIIDDGLLRDAGTSDPEAGVNGQD